MRTTSILLLVIPYLLGCGSGDHTDPAATGVTQDGDAPARQVAIASDVQAELAKIEGKWIGVSCRMDGFESRVAQWYRYTFDGDQMTTETSDGEPASVKFYLDPHADPKQLDTSIMVNGVEEISKGIYFVDGDTLKFSWRIIGDRPADFQSRELDEKIVMILRRAND